MMSNKWLRAFVLLIMISIALPVVVYQTPTVSSETEVKAEYTPHDPIYIQCNDEFTEENGIVSGLGIQSNPYIIEGWGINTSSANGIEIRNVDVYFIIRNCVIHDGVNTGIYFYNVTNGKIENCEIYNNSQYGIMVYPSSINIITNCSVYNSHCGISLRYSSCNNQITNCSVYNNSNDGINLQGSSNKNKITYCNITDNVNQGVGIFSGSGSNYFNTFHHNNFINNGQNAYDKDINYWDDGISEGNYWNDYEGEDADGDGIGDWAYSISGGANMDMYPLMNQVDITFPINITVTNQTVTDGGDTTDGGEEGGGEKEEDKGFIPSFETVYLLAVIGVCMLLLRNKWKRRGQE